jgi:Na+/H+ antiporter NhaD/arsenite permease-like protein
MEITVVAVFAIVYLGMALGGIPGLAVDRTGVALLGAIALLVMDQESIAGLWSAVDTPTLALLFGLMIVSAQFRLGGFYTYLVRRWSELDVSRGLLLAGLIGLVGTLSALLANDIVCLAATPVLVEGCANRRLNPKPFLLALACASNVGSAATLIGNPQNMLIGQVLNLSFSRYLLSAVIPSVFGLAVVWAVIFLLYKKKWPASTPVIQAFNPPFDLWQTSKGLVVISLLIVMFLTASWPREIVALAAGGLLLCSRRMRSREMLGLVDWQLLLLFICLFIVNHSLQGSGHPDHAVRWLSGFGLDMENPVWLFILAVPLSNLVSNVPAVMLLLPYATQTLSGPVLALSSTLAGNLLIIGSIANIIVIDQAAQMGIRISWKEHAMTGAPVTVITLAVAGAWLWLGP